MRQIVLMLVLMMVGSEETRMPSLPVSMKKATYPAFRISLRTILGAVGDYPRKIPTAPYEVCC